MANRNDLENYIMACVRKYEENHPEDRLTATKQVKVPVNGCEYCQGKEDLYNIPFYLQIGIEKDELLIETDETRAIKIRYCPMCARKL